MAEKIYQNWKLRKDNDNILWLYIDTQGAPVNKLNQEVLKEFGAILDDLEQDNSLKGIVLASGKPSGFIAGADIEMFDKFKDEQAAFDAIRKVQIYFDRFEALKVPTVAMIDGFCLGGGTELALACRYRVATEEEKTRIGLPEVMLGINPGWGGTVRMPRLIGAPAALDLILQGKTVSGRTAAKLGLVDAAVPKRQLERAARTWVMQNPGRHKPSFAQSITNSRMLRSYIGKKIYQKLRSTARRDHYPAPYAIVDNWVKNGIEGQQAFIDEAKTISHLIFTPTSRNLVRAFFLQERLKGLAKGTDFTPKHVHVIGAGTMGGDIAAWCALMGMRVTLQDREAKFIAPAIKRARALFKEKLKVNWLVQAAADRLMADTEGFGVANADVIIEAIYENLEAKQKLFKDLETRSKPDAILATNTSSIPLDEINQVLDHPERLVGIHYFNPVPKMKLVEVVQGEKTSADILKKAISFVRRIDKLPLPVKSSPGFLVNRVLMPYLMESMVLLQEGVPAPVIDHAAVNFGMPMGPVELADRVGLDVCLSVAENLSQHFGGTVPERLREMVKQKELGKKTGKGFYTYKDGRPVREAVKNAAFHPDITDRLIMRLLNEGAACLREGVVADPDLVDAGMIYGTGFAPFRGGPMNYAKTHGINAIIHKLQLLQQKYGERFSPDKGWTALDAQPKTVVAPTEEKIS